MEDCKRELPMDFVFPGGKVINTEDIISGLAVAAAVISGHMESSGAGLLSEPVDYAEWRGLYNNVSDAYIALSHAFYVRESSQGFFTGMRPEI